MIPRRMTSNFSLRGGGVYALQVYKRIARCGPGLVTRGQAEGLQVPAVQVARQVGAPRSY